MEFRNWLAVAIIPIILLFYAGAVYAAVVLGALTALEALGVGTVGGVLMKAFSDMWQFYFRKSQTGENNQNGK